MALQTALPEPLSAKFEQSFAYKTVKDRMPVIITQVIDSIYRERFEISNKYGKSAIEDIKFVTSLLATLKYHVTTNKPLDPITSESLDTDIWNEYLACQKKYMGEEPKWFTSPWLYVECYMYRRIKEAFELSESLRLFDPFQKQKEALFHTTIETTNNLCQNLKEILEKVSDDLEEDKLLKYFTRFMHMSLWGNRCDLSIKPKGANMVNFDPMNIEKIKDNILVDQTNMLWDLLWQVRSKKQNVRLDIVLDNAGFELFSDFWLVEFLQRVDLVHKVHFYVKTTPWFISDTCRPDFLSFLEIMKNSDGKVITQFANKWINNVDSGVFVIEEEIFWTLPYEYCEMKSIDPALYMKLSEADVIFFKGDLNYRKLTGDRQWDFETPFEVALRGFLPSPLCAIRTMKADTVTGLKPGQAESIEENHNNWLLTGDFAVIQCAFKV